MVFPTNITSLHIELTDKCQASCPMCPRNHFGGAEGSNVINSEMSFNQFKTWFPESFLQQLKEIMFCGNLGDPLMAKDCLEIINYVKQSNPECRIHLYTNGSLRTTEWWDKLAVSMKENDMLVFAIDGFEDTHKIYRRGTNWQKIIDNAKNFIEKSSAYTRADVLIFKHNEHQIEELKVFLTRLGFKMINARATDRFHGLDHFPVENKLGEHEYYLYPSTTYAPEKIMPQVIKLFENMDDLLNNTNVNPKCFSGKGIYVNSEGYLTPCSWVGSTIANNSNRWQRNDFEGAIRDKFYDSAISITSKIGRVKLTDTDIVTVLENSSWNTELPKCWQKPAELVCAKNCGTNFGQQ